MDIKLAELMPWQSAAINNPYMHFAFYAGVSSGKTFTGSHFVIKQILERPELTGLVGANSYLQLSTATLRELFYWFNQYGLEYVVDCQPPKHWNEPKKFKSYENILLVRNPWTLKVTTIFTRVTSDSHALRGVEFSWYWLDESRDMPEHSHDVVLSRLRESDYIKGLITTTPNGEDWSYKRFVRYKGKDPHLYGSMHVKTEESVKHGIITQQFYDALRASYSELMAAQELDAMHVNVFGGRAYYSASKVNSKARAPWGFKNPDPRLPLIIGCDFNFDPAPHIWVVGQQSPDRTKIHWFKEVWGRRTSTEELAMKLCNEYPGFFFRVFGDRSGARATTSNAGKPDYDQMADVFAANEISFSIDTDQGVNPLVRNRVENTNRLLKNGVGNITMTYDPQGCPFLDGDFKNVGWKQNTQKGQGKLDDGGDKERTHSSDAVGYALYKLYPPAKRGRVGKNVASGVSQIIGPKT